LLKFFLFISEKINFMENGEQTVRIVSLTSTAEDAFVDTTPRKLAEYLGQEHLKQKLQVFIQASKNRNESLDHVLLFGPPGLGKTTLANVIAAELDVGFKSTSAPALERVGDLVAILSSLNPREVLFIDEIHRLPKQVEETLYSAMESFFVDVIVGQGVGAKSVKLPINPFCLIGATTKTAMISGPLQTRFGIVERIDFYSSLELAKIVVQTAEKMGLQIDADAALQIGERARGTPRVAKRMLRRVRDVASCQKQHNIDLTLALEALKFMGIDKNGLDALDRKVLRLLLENFGGGPVGLETLAAMTGEDRDTLESYCEPFLLRLGLLERTPRGRKIPDKVLPSLQEKFLGQTSF
jgi:Holliday junction DNA helicase RuvB